jgi:hypothetical protein
VNNAFPAVPAAPGSAAHPVSITTSGYGWATVWVATTLAGSIAATVFDAVLLQYRRAYFTGGFLATDYVTSASQALAFTCGSLLTDAAVIGIIVACALWGFGRLRIDRALACGLALVLALLPIVAINFVEYELLTYLGDAFDFRLLFDLAGRSPREILAVSSAHVMSVVAVSLSTTAALAAAAWFILRRSRRGTPMTPVPFWRGIGFASAVLIAGLVVMTLMRAGSDVLDNGLRRKPTGQMLGTLAAAATDVDRDGYGVLGRPPDPDLFDGRVRPYAIDIPGNGVDEDGVGGDLPAGTDSYEEASGASGAWQSNQDVVLIVLESFRADARGARVGGRPVTPVLDALAAQGIAPQFAYSHNGYTIQSRRHIFAGSTADVRSDGTLIDDFKQHGYQVAYFSAQDESFGGPQEGVGFERADVAYDARADRRRRFSDFTTAGSLAVPFDVIEERVGAFLDRRATSQPLFLYVNLQDTHFPYRHRGIQPLVSRSIVAQGDIAPEHADAVRDMYLNTASNVDRAIGEILSHVRRALGREPGVIVLSDHGESLFDEGFLGHGYALNDAQTRIPLVVAHLPMRVEEPFVEADLRDAINQALEMPPAAGAKPVVVENPSRMVFQYLGQITRPAQIAFTGLSGRTIYDFREGRIRIGSGQWRRPEELTPPDHARFLQLVQTWERMMLARNAARVVE